MLIYPLIIPLYIKYAWIVSSQESTLISVLLIYHNSKSLCTTYGALGEITFIYKKGVYKRA